MATPWGFESLLLHQSICFFFSSSLVNLLDNQKVHWVYVAPAYKDHFLRGKKLSKKTFAPAFSARSFTYDIARKSSHLWHLTVQAPPAFAAHVQDHTTQIYRDYTLMPGVSCKRLPISYTQKYFVAEIERDTKRFLLDHFINEGVQEYLQKKHITIINWPRLVDTSGDAQSGYSFTFALSLAPTLKLDSWEEQTFIAPKRKNYTDLDTQVDSFVTYLENIPSPEHTDTIEPGDWVHFRAQLRSPHVRNPLHDAEEYWLHITAPHASTTCMKSFVGLKLGQTISMPANSLLDLEPDQTATEYHFDVTIEYIMKAQNLSIDQIKKSLLSDPSDDIEGKLIEVFSYRNDVSLRKAIIEELFYVLFSSFRFDIAPHAITRRKELLLAMMQRNPDNLVYTKQKQFLPQLTLMAEAKLKEESLIDAIADHEGITVDEQDIISYLALQTHDRLREFLYFTPFGQDGITSPQPQAESALGQVVRREKTLNFVIEKLAL